MTISSEITLNMRGELAHIRLCAPERLNALSPAMMASLSGAFEQAQRSARAILLSAEGTCFCSGVDLLADGAAPHPDLDGGAILERHVNPMIRTIVDVRIPIVCAMQGAAAGIGLALALCSDIVVGARSAYFLAPYARIGLLPDAGIAALLTRAVGRMRATQLLMLAERLPAETAWEWGLITQIADDDAMQDVAEALADRLANGPTVALGGIRRLIWEAGDCDLVAALALERELQRTIPATSDFLEGNGAFQEKRAPRFVGK
jgi:2-(1,2-epoxy-1,2-dihydrophenyl)acetyl-CoA isomerase